jgi:hypothetical protein
VTLHASRCRTTPARARSRAQPAARSLTRRLTIRAAFEDQDAEAIRAKQVRVCANRHPKRTVQPAVVTLVVEPKRHCERRRALAPQRRTTRPPRAVHVRLRCASITLRARPVARCWIAEGSRQWFAADVGG